MQINNRPFFNTKRIIKELPKVIIENKIEKATPEVVVAETLKQVDEEVVSFINLDYVQILDINNIHIISRNDTKDLTNDTDEDCNNIENFENRLISGEFNKEVTKEEAMEYLNQYADFTKTNLKDKYHYSDSYISNIINIALDNIFTDSKKTYNLENILNKFKSNIYDIIKEPNLVYYQYAGFHPINLFENEMRPFSSELLEGFSKSSNMQLQLLSKLFTSIIQEKGFNDDEANAFVSLVFRKCGAGYNQNGNLTLTIEDFEKLDLNNDGSFFDELSDIINDVSRNCTHMEQNEIDNVSTINAEQFLNDFATHGIFDSPMSEHIVKQLDKMMLSNDPSMKKLAQMLNNAFKKYECQSYNEKKNFVALILKLLARKTGDFSDPRKFYLTEDNINQLNEMDVFETLQEIIDDYQNYSVVMGDYYTGDTYHIQKNGDVYIILNMDILPNKTTIIDLNEMVKHLPSPSDEREQALASLRQLPAEALIDMWYESTFVNASAAGTGGVYSSITDTVRLNSYDLATMIHETGHALAHVHDSDFSQSEEFVSSFESELMEYIKAGNEQAYVEYNDGAYTFGGNLLVYCTANPQEFFAECYTFLMLGGNYRGADIITEYFPNTLNLVKEYLEQIRNMPVADRRN